MSASSSDQRPGLFAAAWLATLALTFGLGAWWAHSQAPDRTETPRGAARTAPVAFSRYRKGSLDPADPAQVAAGLERGASEVGDYRKQAHLARVAARLDLQEVTAALDAEEARGPLGERRTVVEALLARYAEFDPAAATVRAAELSEKSSGYASWIETPLAFWWKRDARAAQAWVNGLPRGYLRKNARSALAEFLATSDPAEALRQGLAQEGSPLSGWDVRDLFASLASQDLARAAAGARSLPRSGSQDDAVQGVLQVWLTRDPAAAYSWLTNTAPGRHERAADLQNFYDLWSQQDPAAAGEWALAHELTPGGPHDWNHGFDKIISYLTDQNGETARGFVARLPAWAQDDARKELCRDWTERDPAAAASYALSLGDGKEGGASKLTLDCVKNWADDDLPDARAWVERMPPGQARGEAMSEVCEKWCQRDPKACLDYLLTHPSDSAEPLAKNTSFQDAAGSWAQRNPDEMLNWTEGLSDVTMRDAALKEGARMLAGDDWPRTAQMVAAISPDKRGDAVKDLLAGLNGHEKVTEATALVEALPHDKTAKEATWTFAAQWSETDPTAAAAWVATRPTGPARDAAAAEIAFWVMNNQGVAAAEQTLALVQDPMQKAEALERVVESYVEKDRAAAKAWIASSPLFTPKLRAKWLREAEKSAEEKDNDDDDDP